MGREKRVFFEDYSFPVLPDLVYEKNGDGHCGQSLFINDPEERFTISFESGMQCIDMRILADFGYGFHSAEINYQHLKLHLCYPVGDSGIRASMGYFHVEIPDGNGNVHVLPGQMRIEAPMTYREGLKSFPILNELLEGLCLIPESA